MCSCCVANRCSGRCCGLHHLFIVRWLATAQKQRRFSKTVAIDIQPLLEKGRKQGIRAKLKSHLAYVWRSCSGDIVQQSDLFKLTYTLENLKMMREKPDC
ncbi:DUF2913 family protein [Chania multitudinisentens]|uniref:DUF2913 family protein n=1 Tax=Chania multitudinisentens TaxID=1639108 RepID=UPI0009006DA8